jgi:hypothetical protein
MSKILDAQNYRGAVHVLKNCNLPNLMLILLVGPR